MNKLLLSALTAVLILNSCGKKGGSDPEPDPEPPVTTKEVTINGTVYPAVKIGTKTWTTVNYNGATGVNYNGGSNSAAYGKLYTIAESRAITLPTGWRIPTKADFEDLIKNFSYEKDSFGDYVLKADGCKKLKSVSGWLITNGDNSAGFNAFPGGGATTATTAQYFDKGNAANFISKTDETGSVNNKPVVYTYGFSINNLSYKSGAQTIIEDEGVITINTNDFRFSLRFVKDN
jgi:uncharacterized protein (TIGR02145 family)